MQQNGRKSGVSILTAGLRLRALAPFLFERLGVKDRSDRTRCAQCSAEIPPGRAGRRCLECRQKAEG